MRNIRQHKQNLKQKNNVKNELVAANGEYQYLSKCQESSTYIYIWKWCWNKYVEHVTCPCFLYRPACLLRLQVTYRWESCECTRKIFLTATHSPEPRKTCKTRKYCSRNGLHQMHRAKHAQFAFWDGTVIVFLFS